MFGSGMGRCLALGMVWEFNSRTAPENKQISSFTQSSYLPGRSGPTPLRLTCSVLSRVLQRDQNQPNLYVNNLPSSSKSTTVSFALKLVGHGNQQVGLTELVSNLS